MEIIEATKKDIFIEICKIDFKNELDTFIFQDNTEEILKNSKNKSSKYLIIKDKFIELCLINNLNFRLFQTSCLIQYFSSKVLSSIFPPDKTIDAIKYINSINNIITKDINILLPNLDNLKKIDYDIIKEYILTYIDRSEYIIKQFINDKNIQINYDGSKLGLTLDDRKKAIEEDLTEMTLAFNDQIKEEKITSIDINDDINIEYFDVNEDKDNCDEIICPNCKENNSLYLTSNNFYCYNCEKPFKKSEEILIARK